MRILFLVLWYSLRGYVKIRARGFSAERFMNMAAFRGVYLWDVTPEGAGMTMKADAKGLEILESCAQRTGCQMEILDRGGLPVLLRRLRGRQVWSMGLLLFASGLYLLSSFVWSIQVEGNERLETERLLLTCREMGLRPGVWKKGVDPAQITEGLLSAFSDLSWVSVGVKGTGVTIHLAETIEKAEVVDRDTPCDIVASEDGVILQITAERGTPLVKVGDVVKKGDVLISSALTIGLEGEEQHTEYTAAEGAVTARIWKRLSGELPLQYKEKSYSGIEKENRSILLQGREIDIVRPNSRLQWEKEIMDEQWLSLGDFRLPVCVKTENWREYTLQEKTRTAEEAKKLLEKELGQRAEEILSPHGRIENIVFDFEEYADSVRGEAVLTLLERIDEKTNGSVKD
ncbi:MAG: sporulation protein YqfD [Bacillota bacterium]|nr:sporulation protein YqfD [Bacillota bacterium]